MINLVHHYPILAAVGFVVAIGASMAAVAIGMLYWIERPSK
jgi:hypothetical protein